MEIDPVGGEVSGPILARRREKIDQRDGVPRNAVYGQDG